MRTIFTLTIVLFLNIASWAQAPQKMSYQAVIRNSSNALLTSTSVGMKISILQGSSVGTPVYVETQTPITNVNGLVSLEIGSGTVLTGTFSAINWANGPYYIKTETDPLGGSAYSIIGTKELVSVPYALFSANALPKTYTIGLWPELGGYVFWVSSDGKHGLVAETVDQSVANDWYSAQDVISNPIKHSVDGAAFRDWRLPTIIEFQQMFVYRVAIGGLTHFDDYWSSVESPSDYAFRYNFPSGPGASSNATKTTLCYLRAVRSF